MGSLSNNLLRWQQKIHVYTCHSVEQKILLSYCLSVYSITTSFNSTNTTRTKQELLSRTKLHLPTYLAAYITVKAQLHKLTLQASESAIREFSDNESVTSNYDLKSKHNHSSLHNKSLCFVYLCNVGPESEQERANKRGDKKLIRPPSNTVAQYHRCAKQPQVYSWIYCGNKNTNWIPMKIKHSHSQRKLNIPNSVRSVNSREHFQILNVINDHMRLISFKNLSYMQCKESEFELLFSNCVVLRQGSTSQKHSVWARNGPQTGLSTPLLYSNGCCTMYPWNDLIKWGFNRLSQVTLSVQEVIFDFLKLCWKWKIIIMILLTLFQIEQSKSIHTSRIKYNNTNCHRPCKQLTDVTKTRGVA